MRIRERLVLLKLFRNWHIDSAKLIDTQIIIGCRKLFARRQTFVVELLAIYALALGLDYVWLQAADAVMQGLGG